MSKPTTQLNALNAMVPLGTNSYGYITVTDTAITLPAGSASGGSLTALAGLDTVMVYVESGALRFRLDGTNPDTSTGDYLPVGRYYFSAEEYAVLKVARDGATNAVVHVHQLSAR